MEILGARVTLKFYIFQFSIVRDLTHFNFSLFCGFLPLSFLYLVLEMEPRAL